MVFYEKFLYLSTSNNPSKDTPGLILCLQKPTNGKVREKVGETGTDIINTFSF